MQQTGFRIRTTWNSFVAEFSAEPCQAGTQTAKPCCHAQQTVQGRLEQYKVLIGLGHCQTHEDVPNDTKSIVHSTCC